MRALSSMMWRGKSEKMCFEAKVDLKKRPLLTINLTDIAALHRVLVM